MATTLAVPRASVRLANNWPPFLSAYVIAHGICWSLYALLGKGFAYAGFPPFFIGEVLLAFGMVVLAASERVSALMRTPLGALLALFFVWQSFCAISYIETYGIDTLRDSVLWVYAVFGWVTAALVLRLPGFLRIVLRRFKNFGRWYLILGPISWLATLYLGDWLPRWPGTSVSIPFIKVGSIVSTWPGCWRSLRLAWGESRNGRYS